MNDLTRRELLAAGLAFGVAPLDSLRSLGGQEHAATRSIADFFREFTDDWVRHDPELATSTRYFTGAEQDRLERQLTPRTLEWRRDRIRRSYMIGELKLIELREQAKQALGDRFSLRDYHNVVLTTGVVPLEILAREVDRIC